MIALHWRRRLLSSTVALVSSSFVVCAAGALARQAAPPQPVPQPAPSPAEYGILLHGSEAEDFLRTSKVIKKKGIGKGITNPHQLTLTDGTRTLKAVWKTVDVSKFGVTQFQTGGFEVNFRDTYKFEIASYELDKLLGLELVPPTVERQIGREKGSVQLWVEGTMTEWDRREKKITPPDLESWNRQIYVVRMLHQLTYNSDYANIRNVLVDPSFRVYTVDFSRAFRIHDSLLSEKDLTRFSRSALERLRTLDRASLVERLGPWLTPLEIDGMLKRRDKILALAQQRQAEQGERAFFP